MYAEVTAKTPTNKLGKTKKVQTPNFLTHTWVHLFLFCLSYWYSSQTLFWLIPLILNQTFPVKRGYKYSRKES